jgi:hypothetical protein
MTNEFGDLAYEEGNMDTPTAKIASPEIKSVRMKLRIILEADCSEEFSEQQTVGQIQRIVTDHAMSALTKILTTGSRDNPSDIRFRVVDRSSAEIRVE